MIWAGLLLTSLPFVIYAIYLHWIHRRYAGLPGPPRTSFISGNVMSLIEALKKGKTREQQTFEWHLQYGYTFAIFIYHKALVFTIDPAIIKHVLLQHPRTYGKSTFYGTIGFIFGERSLGCGLVTERDYDKWAIQRTALNPAFSRNFLGKLVGDFNVISDELIGILTHYSATNKTFDLSTHFHEATQDVISKVAFGANACALQGASGLPAAITGLLVGFSHAFISAFPNWSPFVHEERKKFKSHVRHIKSIARATVNQRLETLKRNEHMPDDILSIMVKAHAENPSFTLDVILDNMITFYIAGQETSANTLSFMFMELGRQPEILQRLVAEIDECVGTKSVLSYEDVSNLKYCTMVLKETLRMYPVAPGTSRHLDHRLTIGKTTIPRGTDLKMSPFSSARHPDFIHEPEKFDPERFNTDKGERVQPLSYYPFSLGPRSCIGQNFSLIEMKIIIAKILQRFSYKLDDRQNFEIGQTGTMFPKNGVWVTLYDR